METTTELDTIISKTQELCQAILDTPDVQSLRRDIDTFLEDDSAKSQYQNLVELSETLNHRQSQGGQLADSEVAHFEQQRDALMQNTVAKSFMDAQQQMHKVQETVNQLVSKTFELGRVASVEDLDSGSCGPSCGCH